jgi:predicted DNA-binding transcriptional regulator AlpA
MAADLPALLDVHAVAKVLGVSRSLAYDVMHRIPHVAVGRCIRVQAAGVARWIEAQTSGGVSLAPPPATSSLPRIRDIVPRTKPRTLSPASSDALPTIRDIKPRTKPRAAAGKP